MLKIQQVRTWCIFHAVSYNLENAVDVFIPPSSILTSQWRAGNEFHETSFRLPVKQLFQNNFHSFCVKDESFRFIVSCGAILYSEASTQLFNSYCVNHVNNNEKVWYKIQPGWILNFHAWYQVDIIMFKAEARTKKLLFFIFFKFWNILWFNCYPFANLVNRYKFHVIVHLEYWAKNYSRVILFSKMKFEPETSMQSIFYILWRSSRAGFDVLGFTLRNSLKVFDFN